MIKLQQYGEGAHHIYINPEQIVSIENIEHARKVFTTVQVYMVTESVETIIELIDKK